MIYLEDIDFKNKRVLLRTDYNVPLENGKVKDDWKIQVTLPTIKYILKQPKSKIVILSHLGRPKGKRDLQFSLRPVAEKLGEILGRKIIFIEDMLSAEGDGIVRSLGEGEVAIAENVRFYPEEEKNDENFAIRLCHHFGVYVNDAFAVSHRSHATLAQIPRFKPGCAGLQMEKEINELSKALNPPKRPSIAIIGGAKIETKLPLIKNLAEIYDVVLVGGRVAVEAQEKKLAFKNNVIFPEDYTGGNLDIGPRTIEKYKMAISAASFLVWNGPMGKFEDEEYKKGTAQIYSAIASSDAYKIAGGGESVEYINSQNGTDKFDFISSGGGAMLEFLSGVKLPGILALENSL